MIRVLFFGPVAEQADCHDIDLDWLPGMQVQDILTRLEAKYPAAMQAVSFMALNEVQIRNPQAVLADGDVLACMAGFSGG